VTVLGKSGDWVLLADQHFMQSYQALVNATEAEKQRLGGQQPNNLEAKLLFAVKELVFRKIPADPMSKNNLLGNTLGVRFRSWRRVKFFQQYRLFYRFHSGKKVIVYSWFNDQDSLRSYGSKSDAYAQFAKMLAKGKPPTDFDELVKYLAK